MKKLLQEVIELERKVDKLYENTEVYGSIKKTVLKKFKEKKSKDRQDKFTRSRLELFNIGTYILEGIKKKKIKDKDVKELVNSIGFAIYEVGNDKSL